MSQVAEREAAKPVAPKEPVKTTAQQEALADDRRDALRQKCKAKTLRVEHPQLGSFECPCVDISRKGLKLRMPICIPCGSEILIYPPPDADLRVGKARIVRQHLVEDQNTTWFECGIQFTEQAELRRHTWFLTLRCAG